MLLAAGGLISGATAAAAQTANFVWNSPVTGNWSDAAKWTNGQSTGVAPAAAGRADYALEQEKGSGLFDSLEFQALAGKFPNHLAI